VDRNERKLKLAKKFGAQIAINSVSCKDIRKEVQSETSGLGVNVVIDTVGAENTIADSFKILGRNGALVLVGLFGRQISVPLMQAIVNEYQVYASLWGNYNELREVVELAGRGKIKHACHSFSLKEINQAVDALKRGQVVGRAVIIP
jgi:alcohol dehydrogenase, propanol-preferring